jgi:sn-glycerol 3-phosphate transport system permease protein
MPNQNLNQRQRLTYILYRIGLHVLLAFFVCLLFLPIYLALVAASHDASALMKAPLPISLGNAFWHNLKTVLIDGIAAATGEPVWHMLVNSLVMALLIALGKIILAIGSAFALVYFDLPGKKIIFALIFATMMLPIEVRIVPTFQLVVNFGGLNTFAGLTVPLMVSASAVFLFRQFFKTLPPALLDAAKLDGASPWRFFKDILLPLSKPQIAALFIIFFIYGWNQYLWPLLITSQLDKTTIVMGIRALAGVADMVPEWHHIMMVALLAMLPPCLIVVFLQRWFEKGLIH